MSEEEEKDILFSKMAQGVPGIVGKKSKRKKKRKKRASNYRLAVGWMGG